MIHRDFFPTSMKCIEVLGAKVGVSCCRFCDHLKIGNDGLISFLQIDSYKKRLGAVTREKRDYEERFLKLTAEVEKKVDN